MKSKITFIFVLVLIFTSVFLLQGCRKKDADDKIQVYDGVELVYYKMFDDADFIESVIQEYERENKGITIKYRKFTDFENYKNTILNELAEGRGPDIFSMQNTWFASNYRKLIPMPFDAGNPKSFEKTFVDVAYKDLVFPDENGRLQIYALPMTVDTLALYYNKAHFEDRIPAQGRPSITWEGIKEDVINLLRRNEDGNLEVAGIAMGTADNITRAVDILYLLFLQYGVDFYNENISEAIFAQSPPGSRQIPAVSALEFYISFADDIQRYSTWDDSMADYGLYEIEAFVKGEVSMIIGFSYLYDDIVNQINVLKSRGVPTISIEDIRVAPIPQLFDPTVTGEKRVAYANYFAETVSRTTEYPEVAWDFLIELTKKQNLEKYFEDVKKPTSRRDMIEDQIKHPIYGVFVSQIGHAESFSVINHYTFRDIFSEVIEQFNLTGVDSSFLLEAQKKITNMLPEEGFRNELRISEDNEE